MVVIYQLLLFVIKRIDWRRFLSYSKPRGWVVAPKEQIDRDAEIIVLESRMHHLRIGREIERVEILRELRDNLSAPKWKEIADYYGFQALDEKYPINPLLEKRDGQQAKRLRPEAFKGNEADAGT